MVRLFGLTLLLSSALLFLVQPMIGRLILPLLGGSPAVWNTCMVFFQAVLLGGYLYAHLLPSWLGERRHALLHAVFLLLPLICLPIALPRAWSPPDQTSPVFWLLSLLLFSIGLPFFAVATSSPLLQRWFAGSGHVSSSDPYYLYSASNLGSLAALLGYPLLVEPLLPLADQGRLWMAGYIVFVLLTAGCAVCFWKSAAPVPIRKSSSAPPPPAPLALGWKQRLRWVMLAFVPSSLMLSITTYLTTEIAAIPLLWVAPLALYLLTFVLAFARKEWIPYQLLARWMPIVVLVLVLVLLSEATEPLILLVVLHLLGLFWISLLCHTMLARERPPSEQLTEFYLWLSIGGMLGGMFNALLAPLLFSTPAEYPLMLVAACLMRPAPAQTFHLLDIVVPLGLGLLATALIFSGLLFYVQPGPESVAWMFALPLVICYLFSQWPMRFGLGIGAIMLAAVAYDGVYGRTLYRARSFFGIHRVTLDPTGSYRLLVHGDTVHGQQSVDPARAREPLSYYYRTGPIGQVFEALRGDERLGKVGVVGLGTGALACYTEPGQSWTFYEIDPAVVAIARDSGQFTYLTRGPIKPAVILGDARLKLARNVELYGLLVIDAFNSDAIPVHLLTREALQIYRDHLREDGILAFHISSRYFDLEGELANLAVHADPPLLCLMQNDLAVEPREKKLGKAPSRWVVMAHRREALAKLIQKRKWDEARGRPDRAVWTDDYSNLLSVLKWEGEER
jgi:SAM-dependent methyltransferase